MPQTIHLIVVQPTSLCNLNCRYCYVPNRRDRTIMSRAVIEAVIEKAMASTLVRGKVEFLFHAGEPLAAGMDFYRRAADLIDRSNVRGIRVTKAIQTNATLIDDAWCEFFKQRDFHIGVSIDGPRALHDRQRVNWSGAGSFDAVMRGVRKLQEHNISHGAICVLTRNNLAYPDELFSFFVENGFAAVGFNIEEIESANRTSSMLSQDRDESLSIREEFARFMARFLEIWENHERPIKIREFYDMAFFMLKKKRDWAARRIPDETSDLGIVTVQKNGDMTPYSPEFAGSPSELYGDFLVGNILQSTFDDIPDNENYRRIQRDVHKSLGMCAQSCAYFDLCGGAFLSNKFWQNGTLLSTETQTCRLTRQTIADLVIQRWAARGDNADPSIERATLSAL